MVQVIDIVIVAVFFLVTFLIGIIERKKITLEDYWVNNRRTNKFVLIATVLSSFIGAGAILGNTSIAYSGAGFGTFVIVASFVVYFFIFSRFFAPKIKAFGDRYNAYTVPDFLEHRYSKRARVAGAFTILITWLLFLALQILAIGVFFSSIGNLNPIIATIIGGGIVVLYTTIGGLRADIRTDIFQFIVMLFLLIIFLPMLISKAGGFNSVSNLPSSFLTGTEFAPPYLFALALLFLGVGSLVSSELWQRAYAADTTKNAKWAFGIGSILVLLFLTMAVLSGIYGKILLPNIDPNLIIPELLKLILPVGLFGVVIAGFLAAIMSSADTVLLISSMTIVHDFYQKSLNKELTHRQILKISRLVTLILGIISIMVALIIFNITHLTIDAVSFYVVLAPAIIFGFYWEKASESAAFWSILLGFLTTATFLFIDPIQAFIPGLIVSFVSFFVVNMFNKKKVKV